MKRFATFSSILALLLATSAHAQQSKSASFLARFEKTWILPDMEPLK